MIIAPDFLDHWKTRMLCDVLGDPTAPLAILRLWAHCQNRKTDCIDGYSPEKLKAICRWPGDAERLHQAMTSAEWIHVAEGTMTVHGFREYNATLFAAWTNGPKGGRPRKPTGNPAVSGEPGENPRDTHGKPTGNPRATHGVTDKIGLEKIGEDGSTPPATPVPPKGDGGLNGKNLAKAYQRICHPPTVVAWFHRVVHADPSPAQLAAWHGAAAELQARNADAGAVLRGLRWFESADPKYRGTIPDGRHLTADWMLALATKSADRGDRP